MRYNDSFLAGTLTHIGVADFTACIDSTDNAFIGTGTGRRSRFAVFVLHKSHKVGFINEIQKIHVFGISVAVDYDIKGVSVLGLNCDELLFNRRGVLGCRCFNLQKVVNQGQVPVSSKGKRRFAVFYRLAASIFKAAEHHPHKIHQHGEVNFAVLPGFFKKLQIVSVNIAFLFGYDNLVPIAL